MRDAIRIIVFGNIQEEKVVVNQRSRIICPEVIKLYFVINSVECQIFSANNMKMPTKFGILYLLAENVSRSAVFCKKQFAVISNLRFISRANFFALWFILRGDLLYVFPCVILFLCFSVLLVLRLPRLGKREVILVLFVRLFGLCLFRFVGFLFLLGSGKGCGL